MLFGFQREGTEHVLNFARFQWARSEFQILCSYVVQFSDSVSSEPSKFSSWIFLVQPANDWNRFSSAGV